MIVKKDMDNSPNERKFVSFSLDEIHHKVMELISFYPKGKALDLPAGAGRLSWWLHKKGFQVTAGDIQPENFQNPEIPISKTDINKKFPFDDNSFDYAFFIDGPEHVENIYHAFREFARVLKPGGKLIVSHPNYSNIESRLRIVFYGSLEPVTSREQLKTESKAITGNAHINRPLYPQLKMALNFAGFDIERITSEKTKKRQLFLLPLFLVIMLFTKFKGKKGDDKYWLKESNCYSVLMGGNAMILVAILNE
jgi:ubiquinone/menaquinone biosynthesis C-methylase UbiE